MSNGFCFKKTALENRELLNAAMAREAALREELELQKNHFKIQLQGAKDADALQQRLTVAEQRLSQVEGACDLAMSAIDDDERGANFVKIIQAIKVKAALKPAEEVIINEGR